jgi:hypothetical protein
MIIRVSEWLQKVSNGWITVVVLAIFILFTLLVLPNQSANNQPGIEDVGSPDLSFVYTPRELYKMADAYGEQGRREYIKARFTFDIIWPIVYTMFLATALSWLSVRAYKNNHFLRYSNLLPLLGALFDYLENISTSIVMARYPDPTAVIDLLATLFTPLKWLLISASFVLLLVALVISFVKRLGLLPQHSE